MTLNILWSGSNRKSTTFLDFENPLDQSGTAIKTMVSRIVDLLPLLSLSEFILYVALSLAPLKDVKLVLVLFLVGNPSNGKIKNFQFSKSHEGNLCAEEQLTGQFSFSRRESRVSH